MHLLSDSGSDSLPCPPVLMRKNGSPRLFATGNHCLAAATDSLRWLSSRDEGSPVRSTAMPTSATPAWAADSLSRERYASSVDSKKTLLSSMASIPNSSLATRGKSNSFNGDSWLRNLRCKLQPASEILGMSSLLVIVVAFTFHPRGPVSCPGLSACLLRFALRLLHIAWEELKCT